MGSFKANIIFMWNRNDMLSWLSSDQMMWLVAVSCIIGFGTFSTYCLRLIDILKGFAKGSLGK